MLRFRKKKSKKDSEDASPQSSPREGSEEKTILGAKELRRGSKDSAGAAFYLPSPSGTCEPPAAASIPSQRGKVPSRPHESLSLGQNPPVKHYFPRTTRLLHLKRLPAGDFGFTLRKGFVIDRIGNDGTVRPVIFAEPGGGSRATLTPLLPGDRLMEVNGLNVEDFVREEIIELIRATGNELSVGVQAIPELSEVNSSSGSSSNVLMKYNSSESNSMDAVEQNHESMWLITENGYTCTRTVNAVPGQDGLYEVVTDVGQKVFVKERQLERANPEHLNFSSNLSFLRYLNECSVIHTLRHRYANNLIHTFAGPSLLIVNPIYPLAIYSEKVLNAVRNCKTDLLPPHIYTTAQKVYDDLILWKRNQSILFLGKSGSGKTTNVKHLLNCLVSKCPGKSVCPEKLHTVFTILDYLLYSRSAACMESNRSSHVFSLDYDQSGKLISMSVQVLLLGKQSSFRRSPSEPAVDLVAQMMTGLDANQKADLFLGPAANLNHVIEPNKASQTWPKFAAALKSVSMNDSDIKAMCYVVAALIHLSNIRLDKDEGKAKFLTLDPARRACALLGIDLDDLGRFIFDRETDQPRSNQNGVQDSEASFILNPSQLLEQFINGVYSEIVGVVVASINNFLSSETRIANSVLIIDTPGYKQCLGKTATLSDLLDNYVQERLHDHYNHSTLNSVLQKYDEDSIAYDYDVDDKISIAELIHACPQVALTPKSALKKRSEANRKGLLFLMEEESMLAESSDASFVEKINSLGAGFVRSSSMSTNFVIDHFGGSFPVTYDATGWLSDCRINRSTLNIIGLLQNSSQDFILKFFRSSHQVMRARFSGVSLVPGTSSSLRRATSMRSQFGSAGNLSHKSLMLQARSQIDRIIESLSRTKQHCVQCISPTRSCGVVDGDAELKFCVLSGSKTLSGTDVMPDVEFLRAQVRSFKIIDVVGFWKRYHPEFMRFGDFSRRYGLLAPSARNIEDEGDRVVNVLSHLSIDATTYKLGKCHVFLRKEILDKLENCRKNKVASCMVSFQAYCRGFGVRKKMQTIRSQKIAMSIIQKNVRKYMYLKQWPWWRLYLKVRPLVTVYRMELELQGKDVGLSEIMEKVRKIEDERNEYKNACRQAENKLSTLLRELTEEQSCSAEISAELELERGKRLQCEKDLEVTHSKMSALSNKNEQLELNLMQIKVWRSEIEQNMSEEGVEGNLQEKYDDAVKELQYIKKQFKKDLQEELEKERRKRKHVESKLTAATAELEQEHEKIDSLKQKNTRMVADLQDTKIYAEEQKRKVLELSGKKDGSSSEMHELHGRIAKLESERQKLTVDQQGLVSENFALKLELQDTQYDTDRLRAENSRMKDEIQELTNSVKGDSGDAQIRRDYHALKMKSADQEDELNEISDQVKLLEATKNRLDMQIEALRRDFAKELEEKEEEITNIKSQLQKKLKLAESQLEEEYEMKRNLQRENTDLELQLRTALDEKQHTVSDGRVKRLKRDLKRTKALLQDAQTVLDRQRDESSMRSMVRQLKNQLEDAELLAAGHAKALKTAQQDLEDCREDLNLMSTSKSEYEEKCSRLTRLNSDLQSKVEDCDDELGEVMKKFRASVDQQSSRAFIVEELHEQISELQSQNQTLKEDMAALTSKVDYMESNTVSCQEHARVLSKSQDLELSHDLEKTMRARLENNVIRLKENIVHLTEENDQLLSKERRLMDEMKRLQRQISEIKEELHVLEKKETDVVSRNHTLESRVSMLEENLAQAEVELKVSTRRVHDLRGQLEEVSSESFDYLDDSDGFSDAGSYASSEI